MSPYERLANAIILQAVEDYREALGILRYSPKDEDANTVKNDVEQFFRSDWFVILTNLDSEMLIRRLGKEGRYDG